MRRADLEEQLDVELRQRPTSATTTGSSGAARRRRRPRRASDGTSGRSRPAAAPATASSDDEAGVGEVSLRRRLEVLRRQRRRSSAIVVVERVVRAAEPHEARERWPRSLSVLSSARDEARSARSTSRPASRCAAGRRRPRLARTSAGSRRARRPRPPGFFTRAKTVDSDGSTSSGRRSRRAGRPSARAPRAACRGRRSAPKYEVEQHVERGRSLLSREKAGPWKATVTQGSVSPVQATCA